jgi:hypothetical protein
VIIPLSITALTLSGTKRDFVDLYVLSKKYGLKELVDLFHRKFAKTAFSNIHLLKSLSYFVDAEKEPMPNMLEAITWKDVKEFFITEVPRLRS